MSFRQSTLGSLQQEASLQQDVSRPFEGQMLWYLDGDVDERHEVLLAGVVAGHALRHEADLGLGRVLDLAVRLQLLVRKVEAGEREGQEEAHPNRI